MRTFLSCNAAMLPADAQTGRPSDPARPRLRWPDRERHCNSNVVKILFLAGVAALISSHVFAQTDASLATPTGHEVNVSVGSYTYTEPGAQSISIHGVKVGGEYTATLSLSKRRHWFAQTEVRGTIGSVTYTGWCSPFVLTPNNSSPNGYELDFGDALTCSETGDRDWYLEARVL